MSLTEVLQGRKEIIRLRCNYLDGAGLFIVPGKKADILLDRSDQELLLQATLGKQDAFGALYERYVHRIYNYIYYRTGNQHDAEDLTARVFIRAMRHIKTYVDKGVPFSAWLYRIAHNLVANWHRDNSRRQEIPLDDGYTHPGEKQHPEVVLLNSEAQDTLLTMIRKLPMDRQQLLILKYVDRLSNAEIGQIMGRTEGAIKSLYHRTLLTLRDDLEQNALEFDWERFEHDAENNHR